MDAVVSLHKKSIDSERDCSSSVGREQCPTSKACTTSSLIFFNIVGQNIGEGCPKRLSPSFPLPSRALNGNGFPWPGRRITEPKKQFLLQSLSQYPKAPWSNEGDEISHHAEL